MLFITILLLPWTIQMESMDVMPRTLADDLMITVVGNKALTLFARAYNATIEHLQALGGKLAPGKSFLFSTCDTTRKWLRDYSWPGVQQVVTVALAIRDLGAMLNTARKATTGISNIL